MTLEVNPWLLLLLAGPVLLTGELLERRIPYLSRVNIPSPVVGGLFFATIVFAINLSGWAHIVVQTKVASGWWTWLVTPEIEWYERPLKGISLPFLMGFFGCIGLGATWQQVRQGSYGVFVFWMIATVFAVCQNFLGVLLAKLLGESPILGIICGGVTLTGGHGTALGFAKTIEQTGFPEAATVGAAAATFGLVFASLTGGPVATRLIQKYLLATPGGNRDESHAGVSTSSEAGSHRGFIWQLRRLFSLGNVAIVHLILLATVIKLGAWLSYFLQQQNLVFPAAMGAMIVGLTVRNTFDLSGWKVIRTDLVGLIGSLILSTFLAIELTGLNLLDLVSTAVPMLIILLAQVLFAIVFTSIVVFRLMGRDYEAAVFASGLCGFGLGSTSSAMANMDTLVRRFGPAPRALIIVPTVGGLLVDFVNAISITSFLNVFK
ncbi:sodium/glutamate symporter [Planctopirus hydrillae]|uniref:Sodium/glutamate symporter n=1 Tax=Planctopirus hydrillae TaxID=1841610 RepID=A0A1C3E9E2_9PLAN|nr:sodium/glutamate symporter [Planctopirus hydrillae]ODA29844.1 hypothetical protein A6X21_07175 [Planctopirus hydrillae]